MKKRILFEITHPKHFHQFRPLITFYTGRADVKVIARDKDVVLELLEESGIPFRVIGSYHKSIATKVFGIPAMIYAYFQLIRLFKPDLIISRFSPFSAIISKFFKSKTVILPDGELSGLTYRTVIRLSDYLITPETFREEYGQRHFRVNGLFEGAYLNPATFRPATAVPAALGLQKSVPFFLLRFVGWSAVHDQGEFGFSLEQKVELVRLLEPHGKVFISDENELPEQLRPYRLNVKAGSMHTLLAGASIYIGDSSTMAAEAALLGTPSIRYNSFVGENDMSNFKLLEEVYGLLTNVSDFDRVIIEVKQFLDRPSYKTDHQKRSQAYFEKTGDINKETIQIINQLLDNNS